MVRYTLFVLTVLGSAATALASVNPATPITVSGKNVTVIEMNQLWAPEGKLVVEKCALEDCSDTPQG
jgi:hypothetical protein